MRYEESARRMLESYLQKVKANVRAANMPDSEEIVRDVTEHIESELGETVQPVTAENLELVLHRLGEPSQWVDENDLSWWRKFLLRLRGGPESWRLAYITAGLVFLGFLVWLGFSVFTIPDSRDYLQPIAPKYLPGMSENDYWTDLGRYNEQMRNNNLMQYDVYRRAAYQRHTKYEEYGLTFFIFCLLLSFITGRATLSTAGGSMLMPGGQKWLTYPSLLVVYIPAVLCFLLWPVGLGAGIADEYVHLGCVYVTWLGKTYSLFGLEGRQYNDWVQLILAGCIAGPILGFWFLVLGIAGLFRRTRNLFAAVFYPFLNPARRRWSLWILMLAVIVILLSVALITVTVLNTKPI
ncbi:MAG: hypothetical protein JW849_09925 [Phycisphaerae bacterium]|nr:hypothetical protein [Phycisphaerae bacterium]